MSSVAKERGAVRRGERNGFSAPKSHVDELNKEKKRRLILSDSDLDTEDCLGSFRMVDRGTSPSGESSSLGDGNGVEGMIEEEKTKVEVKNKRILRSDVTKKNEELLVAVKREVSGAEFARKRTREPADFQQPAKKLKAELSEPGGKEKASTSGYKPKALQNGKTEIHSDQEGDDKSSEKDETSESQTQTSSPTISNREAEKNKSMELSGNQKLQMKESYSSVSAERRDMTSISRCRDGAVRVQGKSGVLRLLPSSKKVDGIGNHISTRKDDGNSNSLSSCSVATRSASKQTTPPDKRVYGKSSFGATSSKNQPRKSRASVAEERRFEEPKTDVKIVSPKREKKRADIQKSKIGFKMKGNYSLKTSSIAKRTEKTKLRDQLKAILLNAGWTIDLRPRRGRNYEDSVYIPPKGQGGYWSITRAYEVYQEQLSRTSNVRSKNSSGRSSRTSSGSDSLVPMESLSILKRIVVNKRRRKEGFDESKMDTMKKIKKISDRRNHRDQEESEDDYDEIRWRKKPNSLLASNSKTALGSTSYKHLQKGKNKQRGCAILARGSNHGAEAEDNDYVPYMWKRTVLSWMIDMGVLPLNGKVKYMNQRKTKTKLEGWITRDGINCSCCSKILTVSKFELHAGSKLLQPLQNIYLEDQGVSLLQCQLDAWKKQDKSERQSFYNVDVSGDDPNDDTCGICGDGGALICCDGCPSTFHLSCLGIEKLPPGDWHCKNCCCRYCGGISSDTSRKSNGKICSLLSCHQCEAKYHQDCVPESEADSSISKSPGTSFCSQSCRKVFSQLQKILGTKNDLEAGFSWSVVRRFDEEVFKSPPRTNIMAECNSKIAVALAVMDECFLPIVDQRSGINLIHNVMYNCGSNFSRLNYSGFYSFLLERGDEIISVASIRIHGRRLAEMPFIGTRNMYRCQGMCRRLLGGIESALFSLNVEKLVIPAISELKDTWTNVFGFSPLEVSQELEVRSINLLVFPGTGLLQKPLLKMHSPEEYKPVDVSAAEYDNKHQHQLNCTHEPSDCSSDQAVVNCINANKNEAPSESSVKIPYGSADSSPLKCKVLEFKYLENAGDVSMNNLPDGDLTSSHDEDSSQVIFSTDQKADRTLIENHERSAETNASTDLQECDVVSQEMSPNGFASAFQKSGAYSPHMLPNGISSEFVKQKVKNGESLLDCESRGITQVHSSNSVKRNSQASPEPNHDEKSSMVNLKTRFDVVNKESESALLPKSSATDEDSEPFTFEIVSRRINVGAGTESDPACSGGLVPSSDNRSRFFIQLNIVDCTSGSNGTICESSLCCVKNCKITGEEHYDIPCSVILGANASDKQPDLTTPNVWTKSCNQLGNDIANGTTN